MMEPGVQAAAEATARVRENVGRVIVGKEEAITLLVALMCQGHVLLEDMPGVGKTTLAKASARPLELSFQRIQLTPALLPSDVTGISCFNQQTQQFQFRSNDGPATPLSKAPQGTAPLVRVWHEPAEPRRAIRPCRQDASKWQLYFRRK